jgi:hypothetical protein
MPPALRRLDVFQGPSRKSRAFLLSVCLFSTIGCSLAWSAAEPGQGKSYMMLAGDLAGAVEGPRVIKDFCVARFPKRRMEFEQAYTDWHARHGDLLKAIDEQIGRANSQLEKQGAPAGASVVTTIDAILHRQFDTLDNAKAKKLCDSYPDVLKAKDEEMASSVPALLDSVSKAEKQN